MLFAPGDEPTTVPYKALERSEPFNPPRVDRGSRAETVTYGGGLRATSRRIAGASILALVVAAALAVIIYLVNAESANRYSAAVVPANVVELNFPDTGPLASIAVSPGQRVHVGQVLATEDSSTLSLAVSQARLAVASDQARLAYLWSLLKSLTPAQERTSPLALEIVQARAVLAEARVEVSIDVARLHEARIVSPIDGTVLRTAGVTGELVGPGGVRNSSLQTPDLPQANVFRLFPSASGTSTNLSSASQPVISLVAGRHWQVIGEVPESAVTSVRSGEQGTFQFDSLGGLSVPVVVRQIVDVPFEVNGQVSYEIVLRLASSLPSGVLPGMSGTLSFK